MFDDQSHGQKCPPPMEFRGVDGVQKLRPWLRSSSTRPNGSEFYFILHYWSLFGMILLITYNLLQSVNLVDLFITG